MTFRTFALVIAVIAVSPSVYVLEAAQQKVVYGWILDQLAFEPGMMTGGGINGMRTDCPNRSIASLKTAAASKSGYVDDERIRRRDR